MADRVIGRPSDAQGSDFYDAINGRSREVGPETAPKLRSITMPSVAEMRKFRGDTAGNLGPRACILAGTKAALDGGQAVYIWDQTSVAKDDSVSVLQVAGVATGRWRLGLSLVLPPPPTAVPSRILVAHLTGDPASWAAVTVAGDDAAVLGFEIVGRVDDACTLRLRYLGSSGDYDYSFQTQTVGNAFSGNNQTAQTGVEFDADGDFTVLIPVASSSLAKPRRAYIQSATYDTFSGYDKPIRVNARNTNTTQITSIEVVSVAGSPTTGDLYVYKTMRTPQ